MKSRAAKDLFLELTKSYFQGATVVFGHQSRAAKAEVPLVVISSGNVRRHSCPIQSVVDGYIVSSYQSRISLTVDLYTNGDPVRDEVGAVVAFANNAIDDMISFVNFLNSDYVIHWCHQNDLSISVDGDVQDLTGLVNDTTYDYRSRLNLFLSYTQSAVGSSAVLAESSILYPNEDGSVVVDGVSYSEKPAIYRDSLVPPCGGLGIEDTSDVSDNNRIIRPVIDKTNSGGGSEDLAESEFGYFSHIE